MNSTPPARTLTSYLGGEPITVDAQTGEPTGKVASKVIASTVGAGVGAAVSTIAIYLIESIGGIDLPETVEGAALVLISAGVALASGYIKRP